MQIRKENEKTSINVAELASPAHSTRMQERAAISVTIYQTENILQIFKRLKCVLQFCLVCSIY